MNTSLKTLTVPPFPRLNSPWVVILALCCSIVLLQGPVSESLAIQSPITYSVSSTEEVPVRSGQGIEYKIIALLQNKESVTSLEEDGYWVRVRTASGREGWVLKRYLTATPSPDEIFTLATANATPEPATPTPATADVAPPADHAATVFSPATNSAPTVAVHRETNQGETAALTKTEQALLIKELQEQLARLMQENNELRKNERIQWFLAGGGVFIFGWLIGLITCRNKRRKPSLL